MLKERVEITLDLLGLGGTRWCGQRRGHEGRLPQGSTSSTSATSPQRRASMTRARLRSPPLSHAPCDLDQGVVSIDRHPEHPRHLVDFSGRQAEVGNGRCVCHESFWVADRVENPPDLSFVVIDEHLRGELDTAVLGLLACELSGVADMAGDVGRVSVGRAARHRDRRRRQGSRSATAIGHDGSASGSTTAGGASVDTERYRQPYGADVSGMGSRYTSTTRSTRFTIQ